MSFWNSNTDNSFLFFLFIFGIISFTYCPGGKFILFFYVSLSVRGTVILQVCILWETAVELQGDWP